MALFVVNVNEYVDAHVHADPGSKTLTICSMEVSPGANYRLRVRDMIDTFVSVLASQFPDYKVETLDQERALG